MTEGNQKVYGYLLTFADDTALKTLDRLETYDAQAQPQDNEYERRLISVYDLEGNFLEQAWGYIMRPEKVQSLGGLALPSGWWTNPSLDPILV